MWLVGAELDAVNYTTTKWAKSCDPNVTAYCGLITNAMDLILLEMNKYELSYQKYDYVKLFLHQQLHLIGLVGVRPILQVVSFKIKRVEMIHRHLSSF